MKTYSTVVLLLLVVLTVYASQMGKVAMANDSQIAGPCDARTASAEADNMLRSELLSYGISNSTSERLLDGLKHKEAMARVACLRALSRSGDLKNVPAISELLNDSTRTVRVEALRSLHAIVSRQNRLCAERIWKESQSTPDRFDAALLLNDLGDPSHYEEVLAVLQDPASSLFVQAVRSVPRFAKHQIPGKAGEPLDWVKTLTDLLHRKDVDASKTLEIAAALQQIGTASAMSGIRDASQRQTDPHIKKAIEDMLRK